MTTLLPPGDVDPLALDAEQSAWVDRAWAALSPRQRLAQLLIPILPSRDRRDAFLAQVGELAIGGVFQGGGMSAEELRAVHARLVRGSPVPPVVCGDYEASAAIAGAVGFGSAMSLAAIDDLGEASRLAEEVGAALARQGRSVGCRWTFAPVVDVNDNPDNPIANTRSFGDDPERIAAIATAFVRGAQGAGMATTAKHFPGDGQDARDQHLVTTINPLPIDRWEASYGRVFRAAFAAGSMACMIGHIALPAVGGRTSDGRVLPATLDRRIQHDLLRGRLGFRGLIVSDAIGMMGMRGVLPREADRVVGNLAAGSDTVLFPDDLAGSVAAIEAALADGRLDAASIEASVRRVLAFKARLGLADAQPPVDDAESAGALADLCRRVSAQSITLVRDRTSQLPLRLRPGATVVCFDLPQETFSMSGLVVAGEAESRAAKDAVGKALEARGLRVVHVADHERYRAVLREADAVLLFANNVPSAGRGSIRLSYSAMQYLENSWGDRPFEHAIPMVLCCMGSPYAAWEAAHLPTVVACYGNTPALQAGLVERVLGEASFSGRLPIRFPDH